MPPTPKQRIISVDSETSGVDFHHGAMPYIVTTCDADGNQRWWQWDVDPLTRYPCIPDEDVDDIKQLLDDADLLVLQNAKFDAHALNAIGVELPWGKVRDTLMAGHLIASNHPHNLTDMCIECIGVDIGPFEARVKAATQECRRIAKREFPDWRLAREDDPEMPSVRGDSKRDEDKPWKNDMWLPRALCQEYMDIGRHGQLDAAWLTVTSEYANTDSAVTLPLWTWQEAEIKRRGLWEIYLERLKLLPVAARMEQNGVTASGAATEGLIWSYGAEVEQSKQDLLGIAAAHGHDLELPNGASPNDSLREMFYGSTRLNCPRCGAEKKHKAWQDPTSPEGQLCAKCEKKGVLIRCEVKRNPCLELPLIYSDKTGTPTLDKGAMEQYEATLEDGPALEFISTLKAMRSRQTAISYAESYRKFWLPAPVRGGGWYVLHPSYNPTGTDTIRWSSSNPNAQNISKKEDFNLRQCFGPAPGREWWSMDFQSIERRIPAYESGEPKMIEVFEKPDEPPYWGSLYNLTASVLYPDQYWPLANVKGEFRKQHPRLYKQAKFFDLARQYSCGAKKGDLLSRVCGSFDLMDAEFPMFAALQRKHIGLANRNGFVETLPDRSVCAERGYPILAGRRDDGRVSATTPLCYHVSGTAMQVTNKAMTRTDEQVQRWNAEGWDGFLTVQVHDELVWDCPRGEGPEPWRTNLSRMDRLRKLMEMGGGDIGLPTPVSREYHAETWAVGVPV